MLGLGWVYTYYTWHVYDHLDRLSQKRLGGAWVPANNDWRFSQNVNYEYNNRSWLTKINIGDLSATSGTAKEYPLFKFQDGILGIMDIYSSNSVYSNPPVQSWWGDANPDLFTEVIRYDNPNTNIGNVPAQKNGNISQVEWQVAGREKQAFSYTYDKLNRLTEARYADIHTGNWSANGWSSQIDQNNRFNETLTYDKRGNIISLVRKGTITTENNYQNGLIASLFNTIDNLAYTYNDKNQVTQIADAATGTKGFKHNGSASVYTYDDNGNLITDSQKGISNILYNYLNLPIRITFTDGRKIEFIYDATGKKWRKTAINANGTTTNYRDYIGDAEYKDGQQDIIHFSEGYAQRDITTDSDPKLLGWVYKYSLKDHLGNTRVTYSDRNCDGLVNTLDIEQINHYYAFGMNMEGPWSGADGAFKYQYNGKEWNNDFGLGWNHHDWRFLDVAINRFVTLDPESEEEDQESFSPYHFSADNPIRYSDPDGRFPIETVWDVVNVVYDVVAAGVNYIKGDKEAAKSNLKDLAMDAGAMLIPYVPAGASKIVKGADKAIDISKAAKQADNAKDGAKAADKAADGSKTVSKGDPASTSNGTQRSTSKNSRGEATSEGKVQQTSSRGGKGGKGERGLTARPDGTDNPFKKMKPDPKNPDKVILKDANGKDIIKPKPDGFDDFWKTKRQ